MQKIFSFGPVNRLLFLVGAIAALMSTLWTNIPGLMDLFIFLPVLLVTIGGVGSAIIVFFMVFMIWYPHRKERDSRLYDATFSMNYFGCSQYRYGCSWPSHFL